MQFEKPPSAPCYSASEQLDHDDEQEELLRSLSSQRPLRRSGAIWIPLVLSLCNVALLIALSKAFFNKSVSMEYESGVPISTIRLSREN